MKTIRFLSFLSLTAGLSASTSLADELLSGREVLREVTQENSQPDDVPLTIDQRREILSALSPEEAAKQWVSWVVDAVRGSELKEFGYSIGGASHLLEALPGPASWPALGEVVRTDEATGKLSLLQRLHLNLLSAVLQDDVASQWELLEEIEEVAMGGEAPARLGSLSGRGGDHLRDARIEAVGGLIEIYLQQVDDPARIQALLERRLKLPASDYGAITVPDLVPRLGEEATRELLRQIFRNSSQPVDVPVGESTRDLAREVAAAHVDELKMAPWGLIDRMEHLPLYEALRERFPLSDEGHHDYQRGEADTIYFIALIAEGRIDEAKEVAESFGERVFIDYGLIRDLAAGPGRENLSRFLEELLRENPGLPFWDLYFALAAGDLRSGSAVAFIRGMLEGHEWAPADRLELRQRLADALLSADSVEEGVGIMLEDARTAAAVKPDERATGRVERGLRIGRVGLLVERADWLQAGIQIAEEALNESDTGGFGASALVALLEEAGMLVEAQELIVEQLRAAVGRQKDATWLDHGESGGSLLIDLARIYHRSGRPGEVVVLLEDAPWWQAAELREFLTATGSGKEPIGLIAAAGLAEEGRTGSAMAILQELLLARGGYDPAYELMAELEPEAAEAWFDQLFEIDPFEERPLIWKSRILLEKGRVAEALPLVEQAIAIDPSDGEQGVGDRMRAYEVLAEVLAAAGDDEKAGTYREIVQAIRRAERADALYQAGLRERGVRDYRAALTHFSDAYCIQARLARQLQEMGSYEEAEEHYRRAYELMPDSFGRVESHCFGCESVFSGERAQTTAERVFERLREERPEQPQVWYLSGYLEFERERFDAAGEFFLRATELDPDYLNAWSKIQTVGGLGHLNRTVRNVAAIEVLRLDPLQRHARADVSVVTDLRALWEAAEESGARLPRTPPALLQLPAAHASREERGAAPHEAMSHFYRSYHEPHWQTLRNPASILQRHDLLRQVLSNLESLR